MLFALLTRAQDGTVARNATPRIRAGREVSPQVVVCLEGRVCRRGPRLAARERRPAIAMGLSVPRAVRVIVGRLEVAQLEASAGGAQERTATRSATTLASMSARLKVTSHAPVKA